MVIDRADVGFPEEMHVGDVPDLLAFVHQAIGRARAAADQDLVEWLVQERVDVAREEPVEGVVERVEEDIGLLVPTAPDAADALPGRENAVGKPGEDANVEPPDVHHDFQGVGAEDGLVASGAESVLDLPAQLRLVSASIGRDRIGVDPVLACVAFGSDGSLLGQLP